MSKKIAKETTVNDLKWIFDAYYQIIEVSDNDYFHAVKQAKELGWLDSEERLTLAGSLVMHLIDKVPESNRNSAFSFSGYTD